MSARTQSVPDCPLQKGGRGWLWRVVELEPTLGVGHGSQMAPELFPSYSRPRCPFGRGSAKFSRGVKIDEKKEKKRQAYCGRSWAYRARIAGENGQNQAQAKNTQLLLLEVGHRSSDLCLKSRIGHSTAAKHRSTAQSAAQPKAQHSPKRAPISAHCRAPQCGSQDVAQWQQRWRKRAGRNGVNG